MERFLKQYFWVVPLLVILVCGLLAAKATNQVIEAKYLLGEAKKPASAARHKPIKHDPAKPPSTKDAEGVVARNMFCSTCEPPAQAASSAPVTGPQDDAHPPNTTLPLALVATIMARPNEYSTGTVANTQTFKLGSYAVHDMIPDAGEVTRVSAKFVDFRNKSSQRLERIELLGAPPTPQIAAAAPPPQIAPPPIAGNPEAELMADVDKGVHQSDETHYTIDRSLVEKILADPTVVMRSARIVPSIKDGKANGFKLYAIRPNSVYSRIGLQNGDTITAVNGFDMSSPDKALEVYTKVKSASNLSVQVLRRGQPVSMEYSIK